ncbi:MAG: hypothetical protein D6776_08225, partial [Planctomycetota bacterium]
MPNSSTDIVTLDVPQDVLVTHRTGTTSVDQITARERFALTGGTLNIYGSSGPSVFTQSFTQSGGTLGGTGEVQLQGTGSSWSGGSWTDGGTTRVLSGADLTVSGGYHYQSYRNLTVNAGGQLTWSGGRWYV